MIFKILELPLVNLSSFVFENFYFSFNDVIGLKMSLGLKVLWF